jgi:hypothetical protein
MQSQDYDDPKVEARWLKEQGKIVQVYLDKEEIRLVNVEEKPAWFVAPYISLWKTRNLKSHEQNSVWIISGDLPTDYLERPTDQFPREVLLAFAERWKSMSEEMVKGNSSINFKIGNLEGRKDLGALLKKRAHIPLKWAKDDKLWQ